MRIRLGSKPLACSIQHSFQHPESLMHPAHGAHAPVPTKLSDDAPATCMLATLQCTICTCMLATLQCTICTCMLPTLQCTICICMLPTYNVRYEPVCWRMRLHVGACTCMLAHAPACWLGTAQDYQLRSGSPTPPRDVDAVLTSGGTVALWLGATWHGLRRACDHMYVQAVSDGVCAVFMEFHKGIRTTTQSYSS